MSNVFEDAQVCSNLITFAQIFASIFSKFRLNFAQIYPILLKKMFLGNVAAFPAPS